MAKKEVAKKEEAGLPAYIDDARQHAGAGLSKAQEDNLIPLVKIIQSPSPELKKRAPEYIEGVEEGDIILKQYEGGPIKSDEGILFQHCYFSKDWVEWIPLDAGGGFVGRHPGPPDEAERVVDPKNRNRVKYVMPNGNEVIETRYHVGIIHMGENRMPYVIPFKSTGHTVSRAWMTTMNQVCEGYPAYVFTWRLKTTPKANASGEWYAFNPQKEGGFVSQEDYEAGKTLEKAFREGTMRAAAEEDTLEESDADTF